MKLNKTQAEVLRRVFGYKEGQHRFNISSPASQMPIIRDSREWNCAIELARHGLVSIIRPKTVPHDGYCWFVQSSLLPIPETYNYFTV